MENYGFYAFGERLHPPELAVEGAVLDRLRHMSDLNGFCAGEVGNRASDLEQAVVGSGGETQLLDRRTEKALDLLRRSTVSADLPRSHLRIAEQRALGLDTGQGIRVRRQRLVGQLVGKIDRCVGFSQGTGIQRWTGEALRLTHTGRSDTLSYGAGVLACLRLQQLLFGETRHFDLDVDAIQQRTGDALLVLLHLSGVAGTLAENVAIVATGTGVHGGDESEVGGVGVGSGDPRDADDAIF